MTPTDAWGTQFLTEPLATRTGDTFRFMASEDNTTVDVNGVAVDTLNADQEYETVLTSASTVTANNPIQVMQYSNGESYDNADADPFDITIPPTGQFLNSYTVATKPSGADPAVTQNYLNIVAPTSETSAIELDGTDLPSTDFTPIAGSSYSGAQVAVDFGSQTLSAPLPFGLTIYGYGGYDGYGYPGGFTLSPIATVNTVSLSVGSGAGVVGTQACPTATATDQNGDPVAGVLVNYTITGANPNVGFAYTNGRAGTVLLHRHDSWGRPDRRFGGDHPECAGRLGLDAGGCDHHLGVDLPLRWRLDGCVDLGARRDPGNRCGHVERRQRRDGVGDGDLQRLLEHAACTDPVSSGTALSITTPGTLPASAGVTLSNAGTYYWRATYSGDSSNLTSTSTCVRRSRP